jgi:hypothetical protein
MSAYTIDASILTNALNSREQGSQESQKFLARVEQEKCEIICPTLLIPEMAAALSRALGDHKKGMAFALAIRDLPNLTLVSLDESLAVAAADWQRVTACAAPMLSTRPWQRGITPRSSPTTANNWNGFPIFCLCYGPRRRLQNRYGMPPRRHMGFSSWRVNDVTASGG